MVLIDNIYMCIYFDEFNFMKYGYWKNIFVRKIKCVFVIESMVSMRVVFCLLMS